MFGYGLAYALASLSCTIGPFLAVTASTFRGGSTLTAVAVLLTYGAGMALVVGVLAVAVALAGAGLAMRARQLLPHLPRLGGALVVLVGLYVGYYGIFELRLASGGGTDDPVIAAAASVQRRVSDLVAAVGIAPLLVALAVLVVAAVLIGRRPGPTSPPTQPDDPP
jgi:hypothetical protein